MKTQWYTREVFQNEISGGVAVKSIKQRIILMSLIVSLVVATGLVGYWTFSMRELLYDKNSEHVETMARELALSIDGFLNQQKGYLEGQTQALVFEGDYSHEFLSRFTIQVHEGNSNSLYVYFNTPTDAGHFTSSDGWIPPQDYTWEERYWIPVVEKFETVFVGPPHRDSVTNRIVSVLRNRVLDSQFEGVLNIAIDLTELSEQVNAYQFPFEGRAFLLNEEGILITYSDTSLLMDIETEAPVISELIPDFEVGNHRFNIGSMTYISAPLQEADWTLWVEVPTSYFMTGLVDTGINSLLIYLFALLIALSLSYWLGNHLSVPILRLKEYSKIISEGNYNIDIAPELLHEHSEIGEFALSFQHMKQKVLERQLDLMKTMKTLKSTNEELAQSYVEIQALYEEQAAAEETLQDNYDELERYKNHIVYQSTHNMKTGLLNRDQLYCDLEQENSRIKLKGRTLLFISFSEREHYLQTLSATLIDQLHLSLSRNILNAVSDQEVGILYDLASGNFVVLFSSDISEKQIRTLFEQLHFQVSSVAMMDTLSLKVSLIAGGYRISQQYEKSEFSAELLLDLVQAAYHEGVLGKDVTALKDNSFIYWYNERMYMEHQLKLRIEQDLYKGLENNEFYVVYQPQYDVDGQVIAAEALVRWHHPKLGLIAPDLFIGIAEEIGVIDAIDLFVLDEVTNLLVHLREQNVEIPVAINTSLLEWLDPYYLEDLNSKMMSRGLPKHAIAIEITETAFSEKLDLARQNLYEFVEAGYRVHLDDFGTGYSSLMYLTNFPVELIKIDRKFIELIDRDTKVHGVIKGVIELAHSLDMKVVAEGVETEAQLSLLKKIDCDYFQGFYLSKPLEASAFLKVLEI